MTVQQTRFNPSVSGVFWHNGETTPKTSFTAQNTNFTIKGNTSCPATKSEYPPECFTPGYELKANFLDYLA